LVGWLVGFVNSALKMEKVFISETSSTYETSLLKTQNNIEHHCRPVTRAFIRAKLSLEKHFKISSDCGVQGSYTV
jgi:hypothetical protein